MAEKWAQENGRKERSSPRRHGGTKGGGRTTRLRSGLREAGGGIVEAWDQKRPIDWPLVADYRGILHGAGADATGSGETEGGKAAEKGEGGGFRDGRDGYAHHVGQTHSGCGIGGGFEGNRRSAYTLVCCLPGLAFATMDFMDLRKPLGGVIKKHRAVIGMSQEQLAEQANLHRTYISMLERGLKSPTVDVMCCIGKALGMKVSAIIEEAEGEVDK